MKPVLPGPSTLKVSVALFISRRSAKRISDSFLRRRGKAAGLWRTDTSFPPTPREVVAMPKPINTG